MSKNIKRRRRPKTNFFITAVVILGAVAFSAATAAIWQITSPKIEVLAPVELDPSVVEQFYPESVNQAVQQEAEASVTAPEEETQPLEPIEEESQPTAVSPVNYEYALPEQANRVTSQYFDDAIFIGDSLTNGIKLYDVMSNATVFASTGIGLENIFTRTAVTQGEKEVTVLEALGNTNAKKVYVMLGANSMLASFDYLIDLYGTLVDQIKDKVSDDCIIYVQSVLPINEDIFHIKYAPNKTTNEDIDRFNQMLSAMAQEKQVYFLNLAEAFKDENNSLPSDVTPDGMHFNSSQYIIWFDYLKTHAIS